MIANDYRCSKCLSLISPLPSSTVSSSSPFKWRGQIASFLFSVFIRIALIVICVRGTFIVPSFDEIWPQPGKERAGKARTRMGYDYILEAMQVVLDV